MKWPFVIRKEGVNPWVSYCKQRVRKNNSLNITVNGDTGSGKSWAMLSFAEMYDPNWNIDTHCFFSAAKLIRAIKNNQFKKGDFVLYDEAGIDLNSTNWQNKINRAMNLMFQTVRHRNLIIALTFPYISFLTKGVRKLLTAQFHALGYDKGNNSLVKALTIQYNDEMDKFYRKRLMVKDFNGRSAFCSKIKLPKPSKELIEKYEAKKKAYTDKLYEDVAAELDEFEHKKKKPFKELTLKQEKVFELLKEGLNVNQIAEVTKTSERNIYDKITEIKAKGYDVEAIKRANLGVLVPKNE